MGLLSSWPRRWGLASRIRAPRSAAAKTRSGCIAGASPEALRAQADQAAPEGTCSDVGSDRGEPEPKP